MVAYGKCKCGLRPSYLLLVCILANTPGGVKRSGLGAHAVGLLIVY